MSAPIVASGDIVEVDEGEEDEGVGGDDQHHDATVPDEFFTANTALKVTSFGEKSPQWGDF